MRKPVLVVVLSGLLWTGNVVLADPGEQKDEHGNGYDCAAWEFYGYRLGMAKDEALELRHSNGVVATGAHIVRMKKAATVSFFFGADDLISRIEVDFRQGPLWIHGQEKTLAVIAALRDRFGLEQDDEFGLYDEAWAERNFEGKTGSAKVVRWESEQCNAVAIGQMDETPYIVGSVGDMVLRIEPLDRFREGRATFIRELQSRGRELLSAGEF